MRTGKRLAIAFAAVSVFAVAAVASAGVAVLTISPSAVTVKYPHNATLTVTFPGSGPETAAILAMPANGATWTTATIVTTAHPSFSVKPKVTTAYKAWTNDGMMSDPSTVSVAANLVKPQINGSFRRGYTVKGQMMPAENGATVTVTFFRLETVTVPGKHGIGHLRKSVWVQHLQPRIATLTYQNSQMSKWSLKWKPVEKGSWKIVVSHADLTHVASAATAFAWIH